MKVREQIARIKKNRKGFRYAMAGTACLVLGVLLIMNLLGGRVQAQRLNLAVNGSSYFVNFEVADGKYQVKTAEQLQALGASTSGTQDKSFVLTDDLELGTVSELATGEFYGTFDGNGHVITIEGSALINDAVGAGSHHQGVLFGTVYGTVKNLIIELEGEISYTRTSGLEPTEKEVTVPEHMAAASYEKAKEWSVLDSNPAHAQAAAAIAELEDVYLDESGAEVSAGTEENHYKKEVAVQTTTKTISYPESESTVMGEDCFGIVCGRLIDGTISQVYIDGTDVTVIQKTITEGEPLEKTEITEKKVLYYYKAEEKEKLSKEISVMVTPEELSGSAAGIVSAELQRVEPEEGTEGTPYDILTIQALDTSTGTCLVFSEVEEGWTIEDTKEAWTEGTVLKGGESLVLRKDAVQDGAAVDKVEFKVQKSQKYTAYSYETKREVTETRENRSEAVVTYGNNLRAGIVAGVGIGSIREVKLGAGLNGTGYQGSATEGLESSFGNAVGYASSGELRALYMLGSGEAIGTKQDAFLAEEIVTAADEKPESESWKSFLRYTSAVKRTEEFDLAWLVKEAEFCGTAGEEQVTLTVEAPVRSSDTMSYQSVYHARRSLSNAEFTRYYSNTAVLPLGDSGYYQKVHCYATDGYYHYVKDYNIGTEEVAAYVTEYPYLSGATKNPIDLEALQPSVARDPQTLSDTIVFSEIDLSGFGEMSEDPLIYYTDSVGGTFQEGKRTVIREGTAAIAFDAETMILSLTPAVNGKLYEISQTREFTRADREALPTPQTMVSDDYDENGNARTQKKFESASLYEIGSTGVDFNYSHIKDVEDAEKYYKGALSIAYAFLTEETVPEAPVWKTYMGEAFKIPSELQEDTSYYLHVKVSKAYCEDVFLKYGPFRVVKGVTAAPVFYYYEDTTDEAYQIKKTSVFKDDVFRLEVSGLGEKWEAVEYRIPELGYDIWKEYQTDEVIRLSVLDETVKTFSIQTRLRRSLAGEKVYSAVSYKTYTLAGKTAPANSSPIITDMGTSGNMSVLSSGTMVRLTSTASNARILYMISSDPSTEFQVERVLDSREAGTDSAEYQYFQVGKRWYKTHQMSAKEYVDGEPIVVENRSSEQIRQYIHTVVLSENMEPSEEVTHAYLVEPIGTTAAPEASLETYAYPGNTDVPITSVMRNSFLTFSSLTSGAELYYTTDGTPPYDAEGGSTYLYDPTTGIKVEGVVGGTFTVKMKAVKYSTNAAGSREKELLDSEVVTFTYKIEKQQSIPAPTAIPATSREVPTVIVPGVKILLSSITKDSSVYYTTDGTSPQLTQKDDGTYEISGSSTYLYDAQKGIDAPSQQYGYFIIRAVAVKTNLAQSEEAEFIYQFPGEVLSPYANVAAGAVKKGTAVSLLSRTAGATIYYTISRDGTQPKDPTVSSAVFDETQPFVIQSNTVIKAMAVKNEVKSTIVTLEYLCMEQLQTVSASIKSGSVVSGGTVLQLEATENSKIYYTLDGSDPTDSGNAAVIAGKKVTLDGKPGDQIMVKAFAKEEGKSDSEVVTFTYLVSQSTAGVTSDIPSGTDVSNGSKINLMTDVTDAEIYYTTDGSDPAVYGRKGLAVTVDGTSGGSFMIKAVAKRGDSAGMVVTFTYRIKEKPSKPSAAPSGGTLTVATRVELSASVENIYYTTDGTMPTTSSSLYKEPILINRTTTLRAIAVSEDGEVSEVSEFYYGAARRAAAPTASEEDGAVLEPGTKVYFSTKTSGTVIYYTTDGSDPELGQLEKCLIYTDAGISVQRSVMIKAVAYREDMQMSKTAVYTYVVDKIPAVELKRQEAEKLAAEGLQDTDASGLQRDYEQDEQSAAKLLLIEREHSTRIAASKEALPQEAVLVTTKKEPTSRMVSEVKARYGDDFMIVSYYDVTVKSGGVSVGPEETVELGIPVPAEYEDAVLKVLCVGESGSMRELPTRREEGLIYAETGQFEKYALVGMEHTEKESRTMDYMLIFEAAAGVTVAAGIGYYIRQKWKKFRKAGKKY